MTDSVRTLISTFRDRARFYASPLRFWPLPSLEILTVVFVAGTALAISPVGRDVDRFFFVRVVTKDDGMLFTFFQEVLDRLSSQRVVGVLMLVVALWFATRCRTFAPLIIAGLAELMFAGVGILKIFLAKSSTKVGEPDWWDGGILAQGKHSMAYPSGHATEAVLLWGTILLLFVLYSPQWTHRRTVVVAQFWHLIIVNTVVVSWLMGHHWVSDLAAGLVCGLIGLRLVVGLVERGVPQAAADICGAAVSDLLWPASQPVADRDPATVPRPVIPSPLVYRSWIR